MAVIVPQTVPLHIVSPGFPERDMLVCRFDPEAFASLSGWRGDAADPALRACVDVRASPVLDVLGRLFKEIDAADRSRETILAGYGLVLLGELERYFSRARGGERPTGRLAPWQLREIDERVADPERPPPNVAELAQLCGVSPRHLMRCFKEARGMTVIDYVERGAFARAARLLRDTDLPLKAVAAQLGYAQACSFTAAFRRHFGDTPRAYRNQGRSGEAVN
jgi:AraC family transcriptional regulator